MTDTDHEVDFHPDDELSAEEWAERNAEKEHDLTQAWAAYAAGRVRAHAVYGDHTETPDVSDLAALHRVGLTAEQVTADLWASQRNEDADGRTR